MVIFLGRIDSESLLQGKPSDLVAHIDRVQSVEKFGKLFKERVQAAYPAAKLHWSALGETKIESGNDPDLDLTQVLREILWLRTELLARTSDWLVEGAILKRYLVQYTADLRIYASCEVLAASEGDAAASIKARLVGRPADALHEKVAVGEIASEACTVYLAVEVSR